MASTTPLSADDDLFAAKGRAAPLARTRPAAEADDRPLEAASDDQPPVIAPLPGIFLDEQEADVTVSKRDQEPAPDNPEPPPAASLLSIATQESAARRRSRDQGALDSPTDPEATPALEINPERDAPSDNRPDGTARLPVPVAIALPAVIESRKTPNRQRRQTIMGAAACIAVILASTVGTLLTGDDPAPEPPRTANVTNKPQPPVPVAKPSVDPPTAKIDDVQFGNAGRTVVTGRADPGSELVVLHGRQPLGTVRADSSGTWILTARVPTRVNSHEISVAPLQIETTVTVAKPVFVPKPQRRPAPPNETVSGKAYFVQIASLPSAEDAHRQVERLVPKLNGIFPSERVAVRAATIEQGRTVYRVAIDGFATKQNAERACERIRSRSTPCLVMQKLH